MVETGIDGAEDRQQAAPGIVTALQHLLTAMVSVEAQRLQQRRDGVIPVVEIIAKQQQPLLLSKEQEDQPHHHRQRRLVQPILGHLGENRAAGILVSQINRLHEQLNRTAHLIAKLVGDFLAVVGTRGQQRL